jgi:hypothetical protein
MDAGPGDAMDQRWRQSATMSSRRAERRAVGALHPAGMAPRISNRSQWSGHVLERLRQESVRNPDPLLDALLIELNGYAGPPDTVASARGLGFAVPLQLASSRGPLQLVTTVTTFATATDVAIAELKLEAFLPYDRRTAALLSNR